MEISRIKNVDYSLKLVKRTRKVYLIPVEFVLPQLHNDSVDSLFSLEFWGLLFSLERPCCRFPAPPLFQRVFASTSKITIIL